MKILLTGGGTGGHIYPALALAEGFKKQDSQVEILYVGAINGVEKELATRAELPFQGVSVAGIARSSPVHLLKSIQTSCKGFGQAKKIIASYQPDLICGTGGYVCGPVVLAGALSGRATMIHEQNALPGITNRLLSLFVDLICLTFPQAGEHLYHKKRQVVTGLPVRPEILSANRPEGLACYQLDPNKKTILVTGGSQGARALNKAMAPLWQSLLEKDLQIIHITGPKLFSETSAQAAAIGVLNHPNLRLLPYVHDMEHALAAADIIIGRAGASFLAEVMALGRASILIPYPYAAGNHQVANAQAMAKAGAAMMILENNLNKTSLAKALGHLLQDNGVRQKMADQAALQGKRDALENIVQQALQTIKQKKKK